MFEIKVGSLIDARKFTSDVPWAAIQIDAYKNVWPKLPEENRKGLLQLCFVDALNAADFERKYPKAYYGEPQAELGDLFKEEHAQEILTFMDSVKDDIELLFVHCRAGYSRSPAVAAAITKVYEVGDENDWFFSPNGYLPNKLVYDTIVEAARSR